MGFFSSTPQTSSTDSQSTPAESTSKESTVEESTSDDTEQPSKDKPTTPMANQNRNVHDQVNLIGEGTTFEGTVRADNDVRASGKVIGTLRADGKAMIAESGTVEGEIIASNAEIAGRVDGEIQVEERLVLKSTARVDGNIDTDRLVVEEGAQFSGQCEMGTSFSTNGTTTDTSTTNGTASSETTDDEEEETASEWAEVQA